ncbi:hypothetical protein HUJ04_003995 [Dendroctonus ponderosae]
MSLLKFKTPIDLAGYTLVVPSVSVGNVPQLTVDLLVMSLKMENVATLWHPGLTACVGTDPFYCDVTAVSTACELYINKELKIATIQLRSSIETKLVLKFLNDLIDCIVQLKFQRVFILGTGFDYELHNISNKNFLYFVTSAGDSEEISKSTSSKVLELDYNGKHTVRGSGFATKLYEITNNQVNATLLIKYISEGENIHDAQQFLHKLFQFLEFKAPSVIPFPSSWHYIYGGPPPEGIF